MTNSTATKSEPRRYTAKPVFVKQQAVVLKVDGEKRGGAVIQRIVEGTSEPCYEVLSRGQRWLVAEQLLRAE